jgi:hypothetical protein
VTDELRRVGVVGVNTADLGGSEVSLFGLFLRKKGVDRSLVGQVQLGVGAGNDVLAPGGLELANNGGTDHTTVAGDVDFGLAVHLIAELVWLI